ncbi:hypothetical protein B0H10DRAFT_826618 [Mycena sp. CBHHK59/15]|nr:hypothetical protein B0H10DRAFT_826618 [Mycena sp. CBHHK59/15]
MRNSIEGSYPSRIPLVGPEAWPYFEVLYRGVTKSNLHRTTIWSSKAAAIAWFKTHFPWKSFHSDVLRIIEDTYFIRDKTNPGYITTKTTIEQETACFVEDGTNLHTFPFLRTILNALPTHIITGALPDIWPTGMYDLISRNTEDIRDQLASVTVISDVGHYLPVVKPYETAARVFVILSQDLRSKL